MGERDNCENDHSQKKRSGSKLFEWISTASILDQAQKMLQDEGRIQSKRKMYPPEQRSAIQTHTQFANEKLLLLSLMENAVPCSRILCFILNIKNPSHVFNVKKDLQYYILLPLNKSQPELIGNLKKNVKSI